MFPEPTYPTPVIPCPALSTGGVELWLKNDGLTHPIYGGNKVRKAERIVREAERRGAKRILTFGAVGSHHVLTTALFARARGLGAGAVLTPQPVTAHVLDTLRAALAQGLEAYPAASAALVPSVLVRALRRGDYVVPPGGSSVIGVLAYADAVAELAAQVRDGVLPEPDVIVVPLGSGGTCAGLLAGVARHGLRARVLGVQVVSNPVARQLALWLSGRALRRLREAPRPRDLAGRLQIDAGHLGRGYGWPTPEAERALEIARRELALDLDLTYTAKAFASALSIAARGLPAASRGAGAPPPRHVLVWHTLSAAPLQPLLEGAPPLDALPRPLRALLASAVQVEAGRP